MTTLYDELRELQEKVQRLQIALYFWLPSVPANGPEAVADRIGNDAHLLIGLDEEPGPDAEELGWIHLSPSI